MDSTVRMLMNASRYPLSAIKMRNASTRGDHSFARAYRATLEMGTTAHSQRVHSITFWITSLKPVDNSGMMDVMEDHETYFQNWKLVRRCVSKPMYLQEQGRSPGILPNQCLQLALRVQHPSLLHKYEMHFICNLSLMDVSSSTACYNYLSCVAQILKRTSAGFNSCLLDELTLLHLECVCLTTQHIVFEGDESDSTTNSYLFTTSIARPCCFKVLSYSISPRSTIQQFTQNNELTYGLNYSVIAMESIITHNTATTIALTANPETKPEEEYLHYYGSDNFLLYFDIIRMFWHLLCALYSLFPLDFRISFILGNFVLIYSRSEVCWDMFDLSYRNQCLNGNWEQRFYFDHASLTCRQFWFDGCRSDSRNIFEDLLTCQWLCESQPMYKSRACLEDFDSHFKDECNGGRWRQQWYFDRNIKLFKDLNIM
uniref:BPTI/Kunitz inhibitor domain-containing protein n=1 Tax=Heterorhabditis bacteriophora TaxID=37862 RepID=A0A1I7X3D3_HETBA